MADPNDLTGTIQTEATLPISSSNDGQSATGRTIGELKEADQYLGLKAASRRRRKGVQFVPLLTPGAGPAGPCGPAGRIGFGGVQ